MKVVAGRMFQSGRYELIVGHASQKQFAGLRLGSTLHLADADWRIVGIFEATAAGVESEVWADLGALQSAYKTGNSVSTPASEAHQRRCRRDHPCAVEGRPQSGS